MINPTQAPPTGRLPVFNSIYLWPCPPLGLDSVLSLIFGYPAKSLTKRVQGQRAGFGGFPSCAVTFRLIVLGKFWR